MITYDTYGAPSLTKAESDIYDIRNFLQQRQAFLKYFGQFCCIFE